MTTTEMNTLTRLPNGLNIRQDLFAKLFAATGNATQSYKDAGYSEGGADQAAHNLLRKTEVKAAIEAYRADVESSATVDRAYVITKLKDMAENAKMESVRVRALELLGKSVRLFVDVTETIDYSPNVETLRKYSVQELRDISDAIASGSNSPTVSEQEEPVPVVTTSRMIEPGDSVSSQK